MPGSSQTDLYWSQLAVFLSPEEQQWDNSAISIPFKKPQTKLSKLPSTEEILKMIIFWRELAQNIRILKVFELVGDVEDWVRCVLGCLFVILDREGLWPVLLRNLTKTTG